MEKEKKTSSLTICLSVIIVLLLAVLVYTLFFNKKENLQDKTVPCTNSNTSEISMEDIVSAIPFKFDSNGNILSYSVSDLTNADINYAIAQYIITNAKSDSKDRVMMEKAKIEDVFKRFLNINSFDVNVKNKGAYSLETISENGKEYYKIVYPEVATEFDSLKLFGIDKMKYDNGLLTMHLIVQKSSGNPNFSFVGKATVTLDMNNGISLKRFEYTKYDHTDTYSLDMMANN